MLKSPTVKSRNIRVDIALMENQGKIIRTIVLKGNRNNEQLKKIHGFKFV